MNVVISFANVKNMVNAIKYGLIAALTAAAAAKRLGEHILRAT